MFSCPPLCPRIRLYQYFYPQPSHFFLSHALQIPPKLLGIASNRHQQGRNQSGTERPRSPSPAIVQSVSSSPWTTSNAASHHLTPHHSPRCLCTPLDHVLGWVYQDRTGQRHWWRRASPDLLPRRGRPSLQCYRGNRLSLCLFVSWPKHRTVPWVKTHFFDCLVSSSRENCGVGSRKIIHRPWKTLKGWLNEMRTSWWDQSRCWLRRARFVVDTGHICHIPSWLHTTHPQLVIFPDTPSLPALLPSCPS